MNLVELDHALRKLRLSGMAAVLETNLRHAQTEKLTPIDLVSTLVSDELLRRQDRLLERRHKQAGFRDPHPSLDNFDFDFNKKMNRALIHELATGRFIAQREDALFLGPPGTGKSHLAQAIGRAVIQQGYRVLYREAHTLLEELADAMLDGTRKTYFADLDTVPLLIVGNLGMRRLPHTAAEDLLEIVMRRDERASTLLTSNRPVDDWGKLLATPRPSPRFSIGSYITPMYSSADRGAGAPRSTPTCARRRPQSKTPRVSVAREKWRVLNCRLMAGFELSTEDRDNGAVRARTRRPAPASRAPGAVAHGCIPRQTQRTAPAAGAHSLRPA
jgi:DNA replication protein DnaC